MHHREGYCYLNVEQEVHHVAILDDIFLPFPSHLSRFLRALLPFVLEELVVRDYFGADESMLEVGLDDARRLRRGVAYMDRPRADFLRSAGEVRL